MPPEKKPGDESQVQADAKAAGAEQAAAPAADKASAADAAAPAADPAADAPSVPKGVAVLKHESDASASASFRGESYEADEKGFVVVPLDAVVPLRAHGFVMVKKG